MAVTAPAPHPAPSTSRRPRLFWSRLHFLVRLLGLTGGLLACGAGVLAGVQGEFRPLRAATDWHQVWTAVAGLTQTAWQAPRENLPVVLCLAGAAIALLAILVELVVVLAFTATRRSAFGFNAVVQGALAAVVLLALNLWSFHHHAQVDFTRDRQFTLPEDVRKDLARLSPSSQTTIIVYNRHKVFDLTQGRDKPQDDYDKEAQRKVIEKVQNLVEQFRAIGPQIKIEMLDTESRDYNKERLQEVSEAAARAAHGDEESAAGKDAEQADAEMLRKRIETAPENTLFFCGRENDRLRVQQLSFNDFYLLDKTLSQGDHDGRGNLVLLYQGVKPFANRILRLGERKPRVAIATIHEVLSTGSESDFGLRGLRKALEERGFDVTDIVLKKDSNTNPLGLEPAVYSLEESKLESLQRSESDDLRARKRLENEREETLKERDFWSKVPEDQKAKFLKDIREQAPEKAQFFAQQAQLAERAIRQRRQALTSVEVETIRARLQSELTQLEEVQPILVEQRDLWKKAIDDGKVREELLQREIQSKLADFDAYLEQLERAVRDYDQRLKETRADRAKLNEPALEEQRRMTDLKAKLQRLLADCDVLIVPRMTLRNPAGFGNIAPQFYPLDREQVEAIKEFLKAGKPVLACFGPLNTRPTLGLEEPRPDGLEEMLSQLGVKMLKQTVLFDAEGKGFSENRAGVSSIAGAGVKVPPLIWDWRSRDSLPPGSVEVARPPHRIRASLRLLARGLGKDEPLNLRIRAPRPLYYVPPEPPALRPLAVGAFASPALSSWPALTNSLIAVRQSLDVAAEQLPVDPVFLMTHSESWNEDQPFPSEGRIPQFERPKREADKRPQLKPAAGLDTRRRGPFPIGVAVETTLPRDWYTSQADTPARVRLAVIGQGGFFTGTDLPAAEEKLFVYTLNWLLGRDDRLPRDEHVWSYPRINETIPPDSPTYYLWLWGGGLGPSAFFIYLGCVVMLLRRLR